MKGKVEPKLMRVQLRVRKEIAQALRIRAIQELKTVSKIVTEWVESWKEYKK